MGFTANGIMGILIILFDVNPHEPYLIAMDFPNFLGAFLIGKNAESTQWRVYRKIVEIMQDVVL